MLQSSSSTVALDTKEKRVFTLRQFPWHWIAILALFGWNGYLQYKVNDANDVVQAAPGVSARLSSLETTANETSETLDQTTATLQVKVNSEPVFAFLDVAGFNAPNRFFLRNNSVTTLLPSAVFGNVYMIHNASSEGVLEQEMYEFEGHDPNSPAVASKFYMSTNLQMVCAYLFTFPDGDSQQQAWCMALTEPSCGLLNLFVATFSPDNGEHYNKMSILMGLSYAACDSIPAPPPEPEP